MWLVAPRPAVLRGISRREPVSLGNPPTWGLVRHRKPRTGRRPPIGPRCAAGAAGQGPSLGILRTQGPQGSQRPGPPVVWPTPALGLHVCSGTCDPSCSLAPESGVRGHPSLRKAPRGPLPRPPSPAAPPGLHKLPARVLPEGHCWVTGPCPCRLAADGPRGRG